MHLSKIYKAIPLVVITVSKVYAKHLIKSMDLYINLEGYNLINTIEYCISLKISHIIEKACAFIEKRDQNGVRRGARGLQYV